MPMLAAHLREWRVLVGAMVITSALFAVYPFMGTALGMGVCSVLLGFALGTVQPMIMSMLHQMTPHHRHGEAVGMRLMVINASSVAMPMLFGVAGSVIGISAVFWAISVWVGAGSRLAFKLRDDRTS